MENCLAKQVKAALVLIVALSAMYPIAARADGDQFLITFELSTDVSEPVLVSVFEDQMATYEYEEIGYEVAFGIIPHLIDPELAQVEFEIVALDSQKMGSPKVLNILVSELKSPILFSVSNLLIKIEFTSFSPMPLISKPSEGKTRMQMPTRQPRYPVGGCCVGCDGSNVCGCAVNSSCGTCCGCDLC